MPELPDLTVYIEGLEARIAGRALLGIRAGRLHWLEGKSKARSTLAVLEFENGGLAFTEPGTKRRASLHLVEGEAALRAMDPGGAEVFAARAHLELERRGTAQALPGDTYGKPCPVCGAPVQRIVYADNETNYCARCQTGGKILADRALSRLLRRSWPRSLEELE